MSQEPTVEPRQRILLVDDEEALVWSLSSRITKLRPAYLVESATDGASALKLVEAGPVDLLITDIHMEGIAGTELIVLARQVQPGLPVIVMTAHPDADLRDQALQGSIEYFDKPIDFELFLSCIDYVLDKRRVGFSGAISVQTLPDIVQLYSLANATGALRIRRRSKEGRIWFEHGEIVHASTPAAAGVDAFYEIMLWSGGEFSMDLSASPPQRSIWARWTELLMESCRILDERRREAVSAASPTSRRGWSLAGPPSSASDVSSLPPSSLNRSSSMPLSERATSAGLKEPASSSRPKARSGADVGAASAPLPPSDETDFALDQMFADEPTSVSGEPPAPKTAPPAAPPAASPVVPQKQGAGGYERGLDKLSKVDGFIAAAAVDSVSGMVLCQRIGAPFDIELAAAGDAHMLLLERKALSRVNVASGIEDILITLTAQYHLVRPVRSNPDNFFCLILDRGRVNLAIARRSLIDAEADV